jgi:hypothetical protein
MKIRLHPSNGLILAVVAFVFVAAPAYAGPGTPAADANERSATATTVGLAMQDANQRVSDRSMGNVVRAAFIDANDRLGPQVSAPSPEITNNVDSGFAWTPVIGASSAFVFALLLGGSVILVRYTRRRSFAG